MTPNVTIINRTTINNTKMQLRRKTVSVPAFFRFHISAQNSDTIPCANKLHFMVALTPQAAKTQLSLTEENYKELLLKLC